MNLRTRSVTPAAVARRRQSGIATVIVVLLTGLALAAVVFGAVGYIGSLQARSVSLHAATQAQLQAWSALDAARQYLAQIGVTTAGTLAPNTPMTFAGNLAGVSAKIVSVTATDATYCNGGTRVQMTFAGSGGPANTSLESVICINSATVAGSGLPTDTINIKGPLTLSGSNQSIDTGNSKLIVDGAISGNGYLSGYDHVSATGNITLTGGNNIGALSSNGDINTQGQFTSITAFGNIIMNGGAPATAVTGSVSANGTFTDNGGGSYNLIEAGGNINLSNGTTAAKVHSQGSVYGRSSTVSTELLAQGSFNELSCCSKVASGQVGTSVNLTSSRNGSVVNLSVVPGLSVSVTQVAKTTSTIPKVDAYDFQSYANYVFSFNASNAPVVTVYNVNGITSGTQYYLVNSDGIHYDQMCTGTTYSAGSCKKICYRNPPSTTYDNACITTSGTNWTVGGQSNTVLAPGIAFFKGNLTLNSGNYYNTFIATGNISTAGSLATTSVNYAAQTAASNICANTNFSTLYPTSLCSGSGVYTAIELGNVALLAGSYTAGVFSGGHVDIGASNVITGNIVAGDYLTTGGSSTIYGVATAAYEAGGSQANVFSASTTFNQSKTVPWTGTPGCYGCSASPPTAQVLFAHYQ